MNVFKQAFLSALCGAFTAVFVMGMALWIVVTQLSFK